MIRKKQRKKGEEGFTLIELIVVVAILGFLMAIAIPRYLTARVTAAQSATKANLHSLASALELYATENNQTTYPANDADSDRDNTLDIIEWISAYIAQAPTPPAGTDNYRYTQLSNGSSFAIWDPNSYGNTYYAVGPAGVIGEGTGIREAITEATGVTVDQEPAANERVELTW